MSGEPITVLAHRGGVGPYRENTVEAFAGALALGADGVELDVRRSADGCLVVHHDAEIPGIGAIHDLGAEDLPAWVPSLDQALEACAGAIVNVEIKNSPLEPGYDPGETLATEVAAALATQVGSPGPAPARIIVSAFWPVTLAAVVAADAAIATGLLVHPSLDVLQSADWASGLGCVALNPFHSQVTPELVERLHAMDLGVVVWTVNEPEDLRSMRAADVDVVISDRVADARRVLGRDGPGD
jgi:glycerophosphoryl diester phosphodiesterase